jgi:hypothetical protein
LFELKSGKESGSVPQQVGFLSSSRLSSSVSQQVGSRGSHVSSVLLLLMLLLNLLAQDLLNSLWLVLSVQSVQEPVLNVLQI